MGTGAGVKWLLHLRDRLKGSSEWVPWPHFQMCSRSTQMLDHDRNSFSLWRGQGAQLGLCAGTCLVLKREETHFMLM